jgi:O-antigen/teichoic acid export membrane protein
LLRRLLANAGKLLGGKTANALFGLAALAIAARALGLETFGVLVLIHTFTQAVGEIAKFQSWQAVLRYGTPALQTGAHGDFRRLLRFTVLLDGISAAAGMVLAVMLAWWLAPRFGWPAEVVPAAMLYVTSVLFMVTATPTGVLRLIDRFDILATQSAIAPFIRMAGGAVVWALGGGIGWFLVAWYLGTALAGIHLIGEGWRQLHRRGLLTGWRWRGGGMTAGFTGIWRFVWTTNLNTTLELAFTHIGTLAVGWVLGPQAAALFRVGRQFADALAKPAKLLVPAIYPELARLAAGADYGAMRRLALRSALLAGGLGTATLGIVWLGGELLLRLTVGPEFVAAYPVMLWLVAGAVIGIWAFPLEPLLISTGHPGTALAVRLVTTVIYLPLLFWLLGSIGLIGGGIAFLAASLLILGGMLGPVVLYFRRRRT